MMNIMKGKIQDMGNIFSGYDPNLETRENLFKEANIN